MSNIAGAQRGKMGFIAVISLVIGAQIGTGILVLPSTLAQYGAASIIGLGLAAAGSVALALIFSSLAYHIPGASGPYAYARAAFGFAPAFFTGWTYWVISWVSSIAVIVSAISYFKPLAGYSDPLIDFALEVFLLSVITYVNIRGAKFAGYCESILVIFKILPFVIVPVLGLRYFDIDKFLDAPVKGGFYNAINYTGSNSLWLFIGLECATSAIRSVENPKKTIPLAVILGTCLVAIIYALNAIGVMSLIPFVELAGQDAPYSKAAAILFGSGWDVILSIIATIICIGTLNAWVLTSGQVALSSARDKVLPSTLGKINSSGAPFVSLIISLMGSIPLLAMMMHQTMAQQLNYVIEISVAAFLLVYLISCASFLKLIISRQVKSGAPSVILGMAGFGYCTWSLCVTPPAILLPSVFFILSGVPVYFYQRRTLTAEGKFKGHNKE